MCSPSQVKEWRSYHLWPVSIEKPRPLTQDSPHDGVPANQPSKQLCGPGHHNLSIAGPPPGTPKPVTTPATLGSLSAPPPLPSPRSGPVRTEHLWRVLFFLMGALIDVLSQLFSEWDKCVVGGTAGTPGLDFRQSLRGGVWVLFDRDDEQRLMCLLKFRSNS